MREMKIMRGLIKSTFLSPRINGEVTVTQLYAFQGWLDILSSMQLMTWSVLCMRFCQYQVVLLCEPTSFWQENVIAFVILVRVLARTS